MLTFLCASQRAPFCVFFIPVLALWPEARMANWHASGETSTRDSQTENFLSYLNKSQWSRDLQCGTLQKIYITDFKPVLLSHDASLCSCRESCLIKVQVYSHGSHTSDILISSLLWPVWFSAAGSLPCTSQESLQQTPRANHSTALTGSSAMPLPLEIHR